MMSPKEQEQHNSVQRFINRLTPVLWPEKDDTGLERYQVDSMDMVITNSGGTKRIVHLQLIPGVNGLNVTWAE